MNNISGWNSLMSRGMLDRIETGSHRATEWIDRTINLIRGIPKYLQENPAHALAIFFIVNAIIFTLVNELAMGLEERVAAAQLKEDERKFNLFLINCVVAGGLVLISNIALAILLSYPINKKGLVALTIASIALRSLLTDEI